jgi:ABC-type uncharacterized transport system substrate-binding protein
MSDVFISYAHHDQAAARLVAEKLKSIGFSVFYDVEAVVAGDSYSNAIRSALQRAKAVIVLLSSHSRRSKWVQEELQAALDSKTLVVPVLLDEGATENWLWPLLAKRQSVTLNLESPDLDLQINHLVRSLERIRSEDALIASFASCPAPLAKASGSWKTVLIAVISAAIGGLIMWLLR